MVIIQDTREKSTHVTDMFLKYDVSYVKEGLTSGDYSAYIPPIPELDFDGFDFRDEIVIERKNSNSEIIVNLSKNKERFSREFERTNAKVIIMIEDTYKNGALGNYESKILPNQYLGLLHSLSLRYDAPFIFIDKEISPLFIYNTFKYYTRMKLKSLKID